MSANLDVWPDDRTERLRELWAAEPRLSASMIAVQLGVAITRNMVLGKANRIGLPARALSRKQREARVASVLRAKPRANYAIKRTGPSLDEARAKQYQPRAEAPPKIKVGIMDLTASMCRWPIGNVGSDAFSFCGELRERLDQPYCAYHRHKGTDRRRHE